MSIEVVLELAAFSGGFGQVVKQFCGGFSVGGEHLHHEILYNYLYA